MDILSIGIMVPAELPILNFGTVTIGQDVRLGSRQDDDAPSAVERSAFILNAMCRGHSVHRPEPLRQLLTRGHDIDPECRKRLHDIRWRAS